MTRALAVAVVVVFGAITLSAQKPAGYKAPKTPWGDPDLQGNYTNLSEAGTPMERPAEYVGKNIPTSRQQSVQVRLNEIDGRDEVELEG